MSKTDYIYSAFFDKEIAGYTFDANGPNGRGYYKTRTSTNSIDPTQLDDYMDFIAAPKFSGSLPGYVFKMDDLGLGYYRDIAPTLDKKGNVVKSGRRFSPLMTGTDFLNSTPYSKESVSNGAVCPFGFCKENRHVMFPLVVLVIVIIYAYYSSRTGIK